MKAEVHYCHYYSEGRTIAVVHRCPHYCYSEASTAVVQATEQPGTQEVGDTEHTHTHIHTYTRTWMQVLTRTHETQTLLYGKHISSKLELI